MDMFTFNTDNYNNMSQHSIMTVVLQQFLIYTYVIVCATALNSSSVVFTPFWWPLHKFSNLSLRILVACFTRFLGGCPCASCRWLCWQGCCPSIDHRAGPRQMGDYVLSAGRRWNSRPRTGCWSYPVHWRLHHTHSRFLEEIEAPLGVRPGVEFCSDHCWPFDELLVTSLIGKWSQNTPLMAQSLEAFDLSNKSFLHQQVK